MEQEGMHDHKLRVEQSPLGQYQAFLRAGHLAYQYDVAAECVVFYPRVASPHGGELEWRVSKGLGTVYATSWIPVRDGPAYNVVLVDMDEGFRLMSGVIGVQAQSVRIGDRVRVRITQTDDNQAFPMFELAPCQREAQL